jgi:hypothetical protein
MFKTSEILGKIIVILLFFIPAASFAGDNTEINIKVGRASVLMERASDGLSKLQDSDKADVSDQWADDLQNKAATVCALVENKLKDNRLDDKDGPPLCAVE